MDDSESEVRPVVDVEGARAMQEDSQCALGELCALVDEGLGELDGPAPQQLVPEVSRSVDLVAGLRSCYTAVVGAADFMRERTDDIVTTLPGFEMADLGDVDRFALIERGLATLERMRGGTDSPGPPRQAVRRDVMLVAGDPRMGDPVYPAAKLPRLKQARSVDDVVANFDQIIDWAIEYENAIGYFATVYKRATVAIRDKIRAGDYFDDSERMERFDILFAQRYFDALNAYFHPVDYEAPTHTWQWCFDGHEYREPIMLQHMLTAVNSHVNLDLGIAAMLASDGDLPSLEADFDRINTLLANEVAIFLDTVGELSPRVKLIRRILVCEDQFFNFLLRMFRNLAWSFANQLNAHFRRRRDYIGIQDSWAAVLGSYYLHTNDAINRFVEWIAESESRDVARNMRVLDGREPGN